MKTANARRARVRAAMDRAATMVDAIVAAALTAGAVIALAGLHYKGSGAVALVACVATTSAVAYRRRLPAIAAIAAVSGCVVYQAITHDPLGTFVAVGPVLTGYMLGRLRCARGRDRRVLVLTLVTCAIVAVAVGFPGALPLVIAPGAAGMVVGWRAALARRLADTLAQLEVEQAVQAERAADEERHRIARELHDVVAHSVSVMVIQAAAARMVVANDAGAADDALHTVEITGRDAMIELRRVMGVLRRGDDVATPATSLGQLAALAERMTNSGLPVDLVIHGRPIHVPGAIDLAAYRVVQEALTNAVRHGGNGTKARVELEYTPEGVDVEITNTAGVARLDGDAHGAGRGLLGMRERVAFLGGSLDAGATAGGGFRVHAHMPYVAPLGFETVVVDTSEPPRGSRLRTTRFRSRIDVVIAAACFVVLEIEALTSAHRRGPILWNMLALGAMTIAAVWRRRAPLAFLAFVGVLAIALSGGLASMHYSTFTGIYTLALPLYTVAAWEPATHAGAGLGLWIAGATFAGMLRSAPVGGLLGALIMGCAVWTVGRVMRSQRTLAAQLAGAAAGLAAARVERERHAIVDERDRIARDVHALVSYGVVAMVVQAGATRALVANAPDRAARAMDAIERTGRDALAQMRDVLGVLHDPRREPQSAVA